jgi:hypothetical protein
MNEEPNQMQNDHGLPKNGQQDKALGTRVKTSSFGQQLFSRIQSMHCKEQDDPQASSPGLPPLQHCQRGYLNVEKTILSPSSAELMIDFPSPCGAILCNQWNSQSTFYDRATLHQKCLCMPLSTGNTIT